MQQYKQDLLRILSLLAACVSEHRPPHLAAEWAGKNIALLVIGSERGLCGAFNKAVVGYAEQLLGGYIMAGAKVTLMTLGTRAQREFRRRGRSPTWSERLSLAALPSYPLCCELTSRWLQNYEAHELDAVQVVYNTYKGIARYEPAVVHLLPPALPAMPQQNPDWPPIIETDALGLYLHSVELWLSATLYEILLESTVAEQSARFQLLEGATRNAERLIEELTLFAQTARQEAITREMQDLSSGAGLIGPSALP